MFWISLMQSRMLWVFLFQVCCIFYVCVLCTLALAYYMRSCTPHRCTCVIYYICHPVPYFPVTINHRTFRMAFALRPLPWICHRLPLGMLSAPCSTPSAPRPVLHAPRISRRREQGELRQATRSGRAQWASAVGERSGRAQRDRCIEQAAHSALDALCIQRATSSAQCIVRTVY